ncbi:MAG: hypothetical protein V1861_05745 [Candidatus Micrarchaeota archaeon]
MGAAPDLRFIFNRHVLFPRPPLEMAFSSKAGLPIYETLCAASIGKYAPPSNVSLAVNMLTGGVNSLGAAFPCRSGTLAAYEMPGFEFGEVIEMYPRSGPNIIFHVPADLIGQKNRVVFSQIPDFFFELEGDTLHIYPIKYDSLRFPKESGIYQLDPDFGLPSCIHTRPDCGNAGELRRMDSPWVGLIARHFSRKNQDFVRIVDMAVDPSEKMGLLKEHYLISSWDETLLSAPGGPYRARFGDLHLPMEEERGLEKDNGLLDRLKRLLGI